MYEESSGLSNLMFRPVDTEEKQICPGGVCAGCYKPIDCTVLSNISWVSRVPGRIGDH